MQWLSADTPFPDPERALADPPGLLAVGGDLSLDRLRAAYARGIFPWPEPGLPLLWWSPPERCVFVPDHFQPARSLVRTRRRQVDWVITCDQAFDAVVAGCAAPRGLQSGTWITADMRLAYQALYEAGAAHALALWSGNRLIGGLYGVMTGGVFCAESMFSRETDASKLLVWALCCLGHAFAWPVIDAQVESPHLRRLGAVLWPRRQYLATLQASRHHISDWVHANDHLRTAGFAVRESAP